MSSDNEYLNPSEKAVYTERKTLAETRLIKQAYPYTINLPGNLSVLANQWIKNNIPNGDSFYWYSDFDNDIYRFKNKDDAIKFKLACHK